MQKCIPLAENIPGRGAAPHKKIERVHRTHRLLTLNGLEAG